MAHTTETTTAELENSDSVNIGLTPNEARKQRGFTSDINFVPKGQWIFGGTASYSTHHNSGFKLAIIDGIDSEAVSYTHPEPTRPY